MDGLAELLDEGSKYAPRYLPAMNSDHLPMTLLAISGLGGSLDECLAFRDGYRHHLREISDVPPLSNWRLGVGVYEQYPALLAWFRSEVACKGIEATISEYLPEFLAGIAVDAFHPIIRLAYGIEAKSQSEVATALAYMVSVYQDMPLATVAIDLERALTAQVDAGSHSFEGMRFNESVTVLRDTRTYPTGCAATLGQCATLALDVYRSTRDFFALHMVTATHAVRICSRFVDVRLALAALTGGLLAAHRIIGSPSFGRRTPMPAPVRLDTAHGFKYAWTCLCEHRHYKDARYVEEISIFREAELVPDWCAPAG